MEWLEPYIDMYTLISSYGAVHVKLLSFLDIQHFMRRRVTSEFLIDRYARYFAVAKRGAMTLVD